MRTRRYKKSRRSRKKSRKNLRGGFLTKNISSSECDINNLSSLSKDIGDGKDPVQKMHANYQKCCPKQFGMYNSSPYCKQLKSNFDTQVQYKRDISGYYGDETDVSKIRQTMNQPSIPKSKPWYKFWGGNTKKRRFS